MADAQINGLLGAIHLTTSLQTIYTPSTSGDGKQVQGMLEITGLDTKGTTYFGIVLTDDNGNEHIKNEHIAVNRGQTLRHPIGLKKGQSVKAYCEAQETVMTVSTITAANPPVVTVNDTQTLQDGDIVKSNSIGGMTELADNKIFKVGNVTGTTFELQTLDKQNLDGSAYTAYTSGGTFQKIPASIILLGHEEDVPQQ